MRESGLTQLFAAGDGCWDITNFVEPAGDAARKGEGVLVLAATPEIGCVPGSREFSERYHARYGPITNYAANSYDSTCVTLEVIEHAAERKNALPSRNDVTAAIRTVHFQGIAYPGQIEWDAKGDNIAAVTALYTVTDDRFRQIAEIKRFGEA